MKLLQYLIILAVLVATALLPLWSSAYLISFFINMLMYIAMAASWNLFSGMTGYASLGHGLFFGIGAYAFAVSTVTLGLHPIIGFIAAALIAAFCALLLGLALLTTRIRVAYFAIVMLGFNEIFKTLVANTKAIGSSYGLTLPPMPTNLIAFYFLLVLAVAVVAITYAISRLPLGLGLRAIVADEVAAEITGMNTVVHKIGMFVLSSVPISLCGGMIAWYWSYIDPYMAFDLILSFEMLVMAVFGGFGTVFGPVLGAVFTCIVKELLSTSIPHLHTIIFGAMVLALIIWRPGGLIQIINSVFRKRATPHASAEQVAS